MKNNILGAKTLFNGLLFVLFTFATTMLFGGESSDPITQENINHVVANAAGVTVASDLDRSAYRKFVEYLQRNGKSSDQMFPGSDVLVTQTDLRLEALLDTNKDTYTFDILGSTGSGDRPLERKLASSEIFMVTGIGIGIQKQHVGSPGLNQANYPVFTYPDDNYFIDSTNAGATEARSLENLYNGNIQLTTAQTTRQKDISTRFMRYVPVSQFVNKAVSGAAAHQYPSFGGYIEEEGFYRTNGWAILSGAETNQLVFRVGNADRANIAGGKDVDGVDTQNVLIVRLFGLLYTGTMNNGGCFL